MMAAGRCDCGDSRVVDLRKPRGRVLLRREVWGSDDRQARLTRIRIGTATVVGSGVGWLGLAAARIALSRHTSLGVALVALGLAAIVIGAVVVAVCRHNWKERRAELRPCGVRTSSALAPVGSGARPRAGVAQGETFRSPLRDEECLAFEISLRADNPYRGGADLVWREAATRGFSIQLDDGEAVRIPAGSIRLSRAPASARASHVDARKRLPPEVDADSDVGLPCVPSAAAFEQIVRPGDRIAVVGPLEMREDIAASKESPRAPSPTVLVPVGTPVLALQEV
jgi:hypothetical protein